MSSRARPRRVDARLGPCLTSTRDGAGHCWFFFSRARAGLLVPLGGHVFVSVVALWACSVPFGLLSAVVSFVLRGEGRCPFVFLGPLGFLYSKRRRFSGVRMEERPRSEVSNFRSHFPFCLFFLCSFFCSSCVPIDLVFAPIDRSVSNVWGF